MWATWYSHVMTRTTLHLRAGAGRATVTLADPEAAAVASVVWNRCALTPDSTQPVSPIRGMASSGLWDSDTPAPGRSDAVVRDVTQAAITAGVGRSIMLHAAGLADFATGRTLALVAPSGTGKTTAVAALGQHYGYVTDETVIIDPTTLAITPYPKPLSLLGPQRRHPKTLVSPDEIGLGATPEQPYLHRVVVLMRSPEHHGVPQVSHLTMPEALGHLVPQSSSLGVLERGLVQLATVLDRTEGCLAVRYQQATDMRPLLDALLGRNNGLSPVVWRHPDMAERFLQAHHTGTEAAPGTLYRTAYDDALHFDEDDAIAVLHGAQFTVLTGLGALIWDMLSIPYPPQKLVDELADSPHAPPSAACQVRQALGRLMDRGLVAAL